MCWPGLSWSARLLGVTAACLAAVGANAQSTLRFTLSPGPYAVGFRAIELWDHTRTLLSERPTGAPTPVVTHARPLQVSMWYPGRDSITSHRMRFREYTDLTSVPGQLPGHGAAGRARAESLFVAEFVRDSARARRELGASTWAVRDAPPVSGLFPIVVYAPSRDGPSYENSTLAEYLASYGYIVLASPSWGASGPMSADFAGLETQARDLEYLMAFGRTQPSADTAHIALVGDSWGGMSNILVAMRNESVNGVVSLDGSIAYWYNRRFKGGPFVDPDRLTAPVLFLKQGNPFPSMSPADRAAYGADTAFTFFGELRHTIAYLVVLETVRHQNFSALHDRFPPADGSSNSFVADSLVWNAAYEWECRYTVAFLDASLKSSRVGAAMLARAPGALGIPDGAVTVVRRTPTAPSSP